MRVDRLEREAVRRQHDPDEAHARGGVAEQARELRRWNRVDLNDGLGVGVERGTRLRAHAGRPVDRGAHLLAIVVPRGEHRHAWTAARDQRTQRDTADYRAPESDAEVSITRISCTRSVPTTM